MVRQREIRSRPKRKIPKWQKVLSRFERNHLKDVHVLTRKSFVEMNDSHNKDRKEAGSLEPCYHCKHIALKMGLEVHGMGKLVAVQKAVKALDVKTTWVAPEPVTVVDNNKPKKPEPVAEKFLDLPLIYIIIAVSTGVWGIASAVVYWMGWQ